MFNWLRRLFRKKRSRKMRIDEGINELNVPLTPVEVQLLPQISFSVFVVYKVPEMVEWASHAQDKSTCLPYVRVIHGGSTRGTRSLSGNTELFEFEVPGELEGRTVNIVNPMYQFIGDATRQYVTYTAEIRKAVSGDPPGLKPRQYRWVIDRDDHCKTWILR